MKTFKNTAAQGDIYARKIAELPPGVEAVPPKDGRVVVAHSETGHHHVMDAATVTMHRLPDDIMRCFLTVAEPTPLEHLREFDRHEPIQFESGVYEIKRQREYVPEGFRRVED